jgi:hypothetical protein
VLPKLGPFLLQEPSPLKAPEKDSSFAKNGEKIQHFFIYPKNVFQKIKVLFDFLSLLSLTKHVTHRLTHRRQKQEANGKARFRFAILDKVGYIR